ncbi:MAG TPA: prolyl oligopeptidase family serine peptidase [Gemmatimonadaceae bacterium]|nr:prolyl oligopeptidase family serine peptidase [Gemmatimonadaceae bacterium]
MSRDFPTFRRARAIAAAGVALSIVLGGHVATAQRGGATISQAGAPHADPGMKKVLTADDYSRWRAIEGERISSDGKWVAWVYRYTNVLPADSKPELHVLNLDTKQDVAIANATNPAFSPDGRWIVYQVDSQPARGGRGRGGAPSGEPPAGLPANPTAGGRAGAAPAGPLHRVELRDLATGQTKIWHDMQSATFAANSKFLIIRDRPQAGGRGAGRGAGPGGGRGGAGGAEPASRGTSAILYDVTTGRGQLLGSVADAEFNRSGSMLAYSVDAEVRDGNGLFVIDLATGATHALDNDARIYDRLAWNDAGTGVAVLKGAEVPRMRERDTELVVVPDVRAAIADARLAPATLAASASGFPSDWVISDRAPLDWSEDGARVFFGAMPQTPAADTVRRRASDSVADVDVWRTDDRSIQSAQMIRANQDRNFSYREAFDVAARTYVALSDSTMRDLQISPDGRWAVGRDARAYTSDYKPAAADFYRVNTATGERTRFLTGQLTQGAIFGISPDSRKFVFWKDDKFQAYDLASGTSTTLGAGAPSFVNTEYDHPGPKPSWGVAGYTSDGKNVIVNDKYDLWALPLDGGGPARNITNGLGAKNRIILRPAHLEPIDSTSSRRVRTGQELDLAKPVTLSAFGDLTKKNGFYRLVNGQLTPIVYEDASFGTPVKARRADRFLFTRQTFAEFPDLRVSGGDFTRATKITDANPQQAEYRWGHRVLFDFTDRDGHKLQGMLALPDDYKPGEKRPMLVNFYEKNSQNLNRYPTPSFLTGMGASPIEGVSRGYIMMIPDVYYHTGSSHTDQLDAVESATRTVIAMGYADPKRIGLNGHSYGGEGAAFIATKSRLFAAVGVGAGVTDLYTDFSQEWGWSYQVSGGSGENGNQYYLYGQGRWGVSPWDKPDLYHQESALTHVPEVTEPILIEHGTSDPTVNFIEGLNFYNALRYNGKNAILLAYIGQGHGLTNLADRKDLTIRYFQFFDHYLMGRPAPAWMTDGVPFLKKAELESPGRDVP